MKLMYSHGFMPTGSDTWGHLYKSDFMYKNILKGNFFPLYSLDWYNGMELFRYWGPITYYVLAFFQAISQHHTALESYHLFILFAFIISIIPWYLFGKRHNKVILGTILGLLWFFNPDNIRILFGEGNLPRVIITLIFPFLLLTLENYLENKKKKDLYILTFMFFIMTLTHIMITALVGIITFLYLIVRTNFIKEIKENIKILLYEILGIILTGPWLIPALRGGIMKMDSNYDTVTKSLTYYISQSLNPFYRHINGQPDAFYFGIFILIIAVIGSFYGKNKKMFAMVVLLFIGTTKLFLPILLKMPFSQLFWIVRFIPFAIAIFLLALLKWDTLGKKTTILFLVLLSIESLITIQTLDFTKPEYELKEELKIAKSISIDRIALMDMSVNKADASYFISAGLNGKKQVFGWAWQGAMTKTNLVNFNESYIKGYYNFMFDRLIEIGADTVIVDKFYIPEEKETNLLNAATSKKYLLYAETNNAWIFKLDIESTYGVVNNYKNLAIGKGSEAITYLFPSFKIGQSENLLDYTTEEIIKYDKLFIASIPLEDIELIEKKIIEILKVKDMDIYIDMSSFPVDTYNKKYTLFNVFREKLQLKTQYKELNYKNTIYTPSNDFNSFELWKTNSLLNLDEELLTTEIDGVNHVLYGKKSNINFISGGLIYYLYDQKDDNLIKLFENIFEEEYGENKKELKKIIIKQNKNQIEIENKEYKKNEEIIIPIAYLENIEIEKGEIGKEQNLMTINKQQTIFKIIHP